MGLRSLFRQLLGISTYAPPVNPALPSLDDPRVRAQRTRVGGGQLAPLPQTKTRWYQADLERAIIQADGGMISLAAQLWRASKGDGTFMGVLSTRTDGLVRLPKKFRGRADIVKALEVGHESVRSVFDEMFPPQELAQLAADGIGLGVGVGELLPVKGRDYPVLCRLDPQWLVYRWQEDRWYYTSVVGLIPITPGDGRWILHIPGGRQAPWQNGIWRAIGRAFISKEHAMMYDANWQSKLANPARVAFAPQGASEEDHLAWYRKVMAWGVNSVFSTKPGYEVKLLESNGRGYESFDKAIDRAEREFVIATAGQSVTTDGGAGFQNSDIHKSIRSDLIQSTADSLAYTLNTQGIPQWVVRRFGVDALAQSALVAWDVTPPKDLSAAAQALVQVGTAIKTITEALAPVNKARTDAGLPPINIDIAEIFQRFGVPVAGDINGDGTPDEEVIDETSAISEDEETAPDQQPENDNSIDVDFEEAA